MSAFNCAYLTAAAFREVLKRVFGLILESAELSALIDEFNDGKGNVSCQKFLVGS